MESPGVPPGPPPSLAQLAEEENMETDDKNVSRRTGQKTLRFSDQIENERKVFIIKRYLISIHR